VDGKENSDAELRVVDTLAAALDYESDGLVCFPLPHGEKWGRLRWGQYRDVPPDRREIHALFGGAAQNIAVLTGAPSGNVLALDCDDPSAYRETQARLAGLGVTTWAVRRELNGTPHDGGGTFVLRTPAPVRSTKREGVDVLAEGRYFVAPPSLHPGGGLYYSDTPRSIFTLPDVAALDWLSLDTTPQPLQRRRTPGLVQRILDGQAHYPTRSEADAALCASLARAGFTFDDALRLLQAQPGGKFVERHGVNPHHALRYLRRTWEREVDWIADHESEANRLAHRLQGWAVSRAWPGRAGSSEKAVYLAHLTIVGRSGRDPHGASCRELAELAGIGWNTAVRANRRLAAAGLLELVERATPLRPHVWRLLLPADQESYVKQMCISTHSVTSCLTECTTMHQTHDAFRWAGLNKSGAEVLMALEAAGEAHVRELADATGRHRTTVKRKLRQMVGLGLVEPLGDGYYRAMDNPDLDRAARLLGTVGQGQRQKVRHIRDRRAHHYWRPG